MKEREAYGVGLRVPHYEALLKEGLAATICEGVSENFVNRGGRAWAVLSRVRRDAEVCLHGVSLSLGALDGLNREYLAQLRALADRIEAVFVSDHLSFGSFEGRYAHDLWPLPQTEECVEHVASRIREVQDFLGRRIAVENVSSYVEYAASDLAEHEFVVEVARRADCLLLLDVNNIFVNAHNHGFDATEYVDAIPAARIAYVHLAGHTDTGEFLLDDHGSAVPARVLDLYHRLTVRVGAVPTIVEWDQNVPSLARLLEERDQAREVARMALSSRTTASAAGVARSCEMVSS